jgi:hypothetical protein
MAMREEWIEHLLAKLVATYGVRFFAQYGDTPPELVRAVWAEGLDGFTSGDLAHALKHLPPDFPVNVLQFAKLCRERPRSAAPAPALPTVKASPERVQAAMNAVTRDRLPLDPRAWINALQARADRGEHLSIAQRNALDNARTRIPHTSQARTQEASIGAGYSPVPLPTLHPALHPEPPSWAVEAVDFDPPGAGETGAGGWP